MNPVEVQAQAQQHAETISGHLQTVPRGGQMNHNKFTTILHDVLKALNFVFSLFEHNPALNETPENGSVKTSPASGGTTSSIAGADHIGGNGNTVLDGGPQGATVANPQGAGAGPSL